MKPSSRRLATIMLGAALLAAVSLQPQRASADKGGSSSNEAAVRTKTETIDGSSGGHFNVQSWVLTVPAGAYRGKGTITVTVSGNSNQTVALSITPASLTPFLRPVTLEYTRCQPGEDVGNESIYTWDPNTATWSPAPGQAGDVTAGTLRSLLPAMATMKIRGGRAGW